MKQTFAEALKSERESAGLSMRELADRVTTLGVKMDSSTLHRMEHGQREPKLSEALALSRLLHFDLSDLSTALDTAEALAGRFANELVRTLAVVADLGAVTQDFYEAILDGAGAPSEATIVEAVATSGLAAARSLDYDLALSTEQRADFSVGAAVVAWLDEEIGIGDGPPAAP